MRYINLRLAYIVTYAVDFRPKQFEPTTSRNVMQS